MTITIIINNARFTQVNPLSALIQNGSLLTLTANVKEKRGSHGRKGSGSFDKGTKIQALKIRIGFFILFN